MDVDIFAKLYKFLILFVLVIYVCEVFNKLPE